MPPIDHSRPLTVIFGCGYVGSRLARTLLAEGFPVRACARRLERLAPLAELGAELFPIDAAKVKQFGPALRGTSSARVLYSIPPVPNIPGGEAVRRATSAAMNAGVSSFVFLGSSGMYGGRPDTSWVDEDTSVALDDANMRSWLMDEQAVQDGQRSGLRTVVLRLAAIYGPGRGVRQRLLKGDYKLIDNGQHYTSRIHVDDLCTIIRAAGERAQGGSTYLVADDRPTQQREYAEWLCARLGLPLPPALPAFSPGASRTILRGRRLRNDRVKRELEVTLAYPTFAEGEVQIEAEERGEGPSVMTTTPADLHRSPRLTENLPIASPDAILDTPTSPIAVAAAVAAPPEPAARPPVDAIKPGRPPNVRHYSVVGNDGGRSYPNSTEQLSIGTPLGRALGLHRLGVHHELLPPGHRTSWPHAHSDEEELLYVLDGTPDLWLDGALHPLSPGDVVAFPPGTGVAHTVINNGEAPARLLVVGEHRRSGDRVSYPLHPAREASLPNERRWADAPRHGLGQHDGLPDAQRDKK